jgi:threonine/homoserine/homoserine lactone efflux protein
MMTDSTALTLFLLGLALAASPGPDSVLIVRNTLVEGRRIGFMTLLGNRIGLCAHVAAAITGLSVALQNSPALYFGVRVMGAVYLVYLGASKLVARARGTRASGATSTQEGAAAMTAVRDGMLNNLLNPKVSLFFLSLFPQFASGELLSRSPVAVAALFLAGNTVWYVLLVMVVGLRGLRERVQRFQGALDLAFAVGFVVLGSVIATTEIAALAMR